MNGNHIPKEWLEKIYESSEGDVLLKFHDIEIKHLRLNKTLHATGFTVKIKKQNWKSFL